MNRSILKKFTLSLFLILLFVATQVLVVSQVHLETPGAARSNAKRKSLMGFYDIRFFGGPALENLLQPRRASLPRVQMRMASLQSATNKLRAATPDAEVRLSPITGAIEMVSANEGTLTDFAGDRNGWDIVRDFLRVNADAYGIDSQQVDQLHFIGESDSPSGLRMVRFEQVINDVPVFLSETRALLDRDGRLVRTLGSLASGADDAEPLTGLISPADALTSAMASVGLQLDASVASVRNQIGEGKKPLVRTNHPKIDGDVESKLVYFALAPGVLIPAWSQVTFTKTDCDWHTVVDAQSGALLWRKNMRADVSAQDARFRVYVQADGTTPADSPAPHSPTNVTLGSGAQFPEIAPTVVSMHTAMDATASPNGWINDGGGTTTGNNVDAYLDRVQGTGETNVPDIGALDNNGRPIGNPDVNTLNRDFLGFAPRDFQTGFLPPPQGGDPEAGQTATGAPSATLDSFRRGVVTHLFYVCNWYHDQLYKLGFNEAAGNFQDSTFGRGGVGNDHVKAEAEDGSFTNNANFSSPPDGASGRVQMFVWTGPTVDRDGDLDQEVLVHELTHGLSSRLIGNADGLNFSPGQGMGEGWSDFFALSLLNNTNADDPDGMYAPGAYAFYKGFGLPFTDNYLYGVRRFPYSTNNSINPLTWADVDAVTMNMAGGIPPSPLGFEFNGAFEVHNVGEIWCLSLWGMRSRIIHDPAGANGDVPTGNHTSLQLVTDALKMTPSNPSFTDARDALIAADGATNSFANEPSIWGAFADRGLGYKAVAPLGISGFANLGEMGVGESFSAPYLDVASVAIDDANGNHNGFVDPGEPIALTVGLTNPWHVASKSATSTAAVLSSPTPGVTIVTGNANYGVVAPRTTVAETFRIQLSALSLAAGQSLQFNLQTSSSLGASTTSFMLRVGAPSGPRAPITYTQTIPGGLAIPNIDFIGANTTMPISDDFEIADLNFRVDSLTHPHTSDLTIMLRAPNGYGTDLIFARQAFFRSPLNGADYINTVIDDQVAGDSAHDLNTAGPGRAPYTGSWRPAFNSPVFNLLGRPGIHPDAIGQLGRLNGLSTKGNWTVQVTDNFSANSGGRLNAWSLIVTPVSYITMPFFDVCLQDDSNSSVKFLGNTLTGEYRLCSCGGASFTGVATVTKRGAVESFQQNGPDRRLTVIFDGGAFRGTATFHSPLGVNNCTITDRDTRNNTCSCQ